MVYDGALGSLGALFLKMPSLMLVKSKAGRVYDLETFLDYLDITFQGSATFATSIQCHMDYLPLLLGEEDTSYAPEMKYLYEMLLELRNAARAMTPKNHLD